MAACGPGVEGARLAALPLEPLAGGGVCVHLSELGGDVGTCPLTPGGSGVTSAEAERPSSARAGHGPFFQY